jgi:mannitol/fructose-specific phosphotransferase system IIA component (Ntr-type)
MASEKTSLPANTLEAAVWAREEALSTGLGNGVAMPHARINGIEESVVAVGISDVGIDFDAPDGKPAHVILLVLTPTRDAGAQIEIAAEIAGMFRDTRLLDSVLQVSNYTAFLALIKTILEDSPEATQTT